uniref:WGS project CAEQ00000000 data, annotated contig 277 n=1 Tax=Trypanosoma congolense (strain IL3000) TaxID=1068625 RepID=F9WEJ5_TRYCI|nr:unnamed protein product [Trypanosoma congolense IL3000]
MLGPIQVAVGFVVGIMLAYALYFSVFNIFYKEGERVPLGGLKILYFTERHSNHVRFATMTLILLFSMLCTSVASLVQCVGGAAVAIVVMLSLFSHWCDAAHKLEHDTTKGDLSVAFRFVWDYIAMPGLFGLAGSTVDFGAIFTKDFFGSGITCVLTGLAVRFVVSALTPFLFRMPFSFRELIFTGIGSLGKGPLQAVFAGIPLLNVNEQHGSANPTNLTGRSYEEDVRYAETLQNSTILSMLVACLLCSTLLSVFSQKLLRHDAPCSLSGDQMEIISNGEDCPPTSRCTAGRGPDITTRQN